LKRGVVAALPGGNRKFDLILQREFDVVARSSHMALIETRGEPRAAVEQTALRDWVRALEATAPIATNPQRLLPGVIDELALAQGDAPALWSAGECFSYRDLAGRMHRFARWALDHGLAAGDTVALMMPNRPEYMAIWLGLSSVGVVVALLNTNLRDRALAHCIDIVAPKHIIVAAELSGAFASATAHLAQHPRPWSHGGGEFERLDQAVARCPPPTARS
jgi:fatty-acyl-CoA synthase